MIHNPKKCGCCNKDFKKGDNAILHNDYAKWYFCGEDCYKKWLRIFKVKIDIVIGDDTPDINYDEMEEFF